MQFHLKALMIKNNYVFDVKYTSKYTKLIYH